AKGVMGRAAIANAKMAYARFQQVFAGERWERLRAQGAHVQRPLWASTSTKNPAYRDVIYVEELIGPDTVNTVPLATLKAFADHGQVRRTVDIDLDRARADLATLQELGVSLDDVTTQLQVEGVEKFAKSFRQMIQAVGEKLERVAQGT
ncbi:MAG TPA: transaldolase family protein, partial [Longimicrobium sp.]|nr:transaldolase family protein [Longimicrobium sp.]